jgi:hypothetical protein
MNVPQRAKQTGQSPPVGVANVVQRATAQVGRVQLRPSGALAGRPSAPARPSAVPARSAMDMLRGSGQPLAAPLRHEMEGRLGADFSDVRVHTDAAARTAAAALGARAYTAGSHVVIGAGGADKHTLAHELTHVIQQRSGPVTGTDHGAGLRVSEPSDRFEHAAEENARRAMSGTTREPEARGSAGLVRPTAQWAPTIQRFAVDPNTGMFTSDNGLYKVFRGRSTVWVRNGTLTDPVLRRVVPQTRLKRFAGYTSYEVGRQVRKDCLHAAEELINESPGELEEGVGLHSTIDVATRGGGTIRKKFGASYTANIDFAQRFAGRRDDAADPQVGEAFIIVATAPLTGHSMSPYHAAAVVGRDGNDAVTLETWDSAGTSLPKADMYEVGNAANSFHAYWEQQYFNGTSPTTVVLRPVVRQSDLVMRTQPQRRNPNVKPY